MSQNDQNRLLLNESLDLLIQSLETLMLSVDKCTILIKKDMYSFEDMESFDSLTSKFCRTSDIYTQKVLRTIWLLLHEPFVPFIDLINKAEKLSIIQSADTLLAIRDLRNQITHEYIPEAITKIIPDVIAYAKLLVDNVALSKDFIQSRNWIP
jgi:hypothetical protein